MADQHEQIISLRDSWQETPGSNFVKAVGESAIEGQGPLLLIHGSFLAGKHWGPVQNGLAEHGYDSLAPTLDSENTQATIEDDVKVLASAVQGLGQFSILAWSRGLETVVPLVERVGAERVSNVIFVSCGGPHGFKVGANDQLEPTLPRYSEAFMDARQEVTPGQYRLDPAKSQSVLYNQATDQALVNWAIAGQRLQRHADIDLTVATTRLPVSIPRTYVLGGRDKVLNLARAKLVALEWAGVTPTMIPDWDHTPQISRPDEFSHCIASILSATTRHTIVLPKDQAATAQQSSAQY